MSHLLGDMVVGPLDWLLYDRELQWTIAGIVAGVAVLTVVLVIVLVHHKRKAHWSKKGQ